MSYSRDSLDNEYFFVIIFFSPYSKRVIFMWGGAQRGCDFLWPLYQKELLKECFPQILMPPSRGPCGTDFSELDQSRAERLIPAHTHSHRHTHKSLWRTLGREEPSLDPTSCLIFTSLTLRKFSSGMKVVACLSSCVTSSFLLLCKSQSMMLTDLNVFGF